MPKKPAAPKAIVIDDAYGLPTSKTLREHLPGLRSFLVRNSAAKSWFDATFDLTGKATVPTYFDPLLESIEKLKLFWDEREKCPEPKYLSEAIGGLVAEVAPKKSPLATVEKELGDRGWHIKSLSQLPAVEDVDQDISLIVIDYVLQEDMPNDVIEKVKKSIEFLQLFLVRSATSGRCPLVVLISTLPSGQTQAESFKAEINLQGAFFRFISKSSIADNLGDCVDGFLREREELDAFRKFHTDFAASLDEGVKALTAQIQKLELQDLATLQVGQLHFEGESLGDYLGWMCGQVLTTKLQRDPALADSSEKLPKKSYKVLLGHLEPTQGIPKLFTELSSVCAASGELAKQRHHQRAIRFGDVFAAVRSMTVEENQVKYYLVISQTCDLLHGKLVNGHVLCVEGEATEFSPTEASLLEATFKQMQDLGQILMESNGKYLQIEWKKKQLITLQQKKLEKEKGFRYVGRLNEIYALEVQQDALHSLARIGVPIKPGYGFFFSEARLKVFSSKKEIDALGVTLKKETILAAMRLNKGAKYHLLLSVDLRSWLNSQMTRLESDETFPTELKTVTDGFKQWLADDDFRIICNGKNGVEASREIAEDGKTSSRKIDKFELLLPQLTVFGIASPKNGVRLSLELVRI